jgi:hypothetical protein
MVRCGVYSRTRKPRSRRPWRAANGGGGWREGRVYRPLLRHVHHALVRARAGSAPPGECRCTGGRGDQLHRRVGRVGVRARSGQGPGRDRADDLRRRVRGGHRPRTGAGRLHAEHVLGRGWRSAAAVAVATGRSDDNRPSRNGSHPSPPRTRQCRHRGSYRTLTCSSAPSAAARGTPRAPCSSVRRACALRYAPRPFARARAARGPTRSAPCSRENTAR